MTSKPFAVGVFTHPDPDLKAPYFVDSLRGLAEVLLKKSYVVDVNPSFEGLDGALLLGPADDDPALAHVLRTGLPGVVLQGVSDRLPAVGLDNVAAARRVVEHLVSLGHRRVAVIDGRLYVADGRDRHEGWRQALVAAGLEADPALAVSAEFDEGKGARAMERLLALERPPTAVFAANDHMAAGAIKAVRASGRRVPEDVAVAGFDDMAAAAGMGLTTFRQPFAAIAREGARVLASWLAGGARPAPRRFLVEGELVVRETCGARLAGRGKG